MTKHELVTELAARLGLSRAKAGLAIETLFGKNGILPTELCKGSRVQITGFGQFSRGMSFSPTIVACGS